MDGYSSGLSLLFRVQMHLCALPLTHVVETMRPLPIEQLSSAPRFVRGLSVIRGVPTPVVDVARLFDGEDSFPTRFVTIAIGGRRAALAVDSVLGVRPIPLGSLQALPPLLQNADAVSAIGTLDAELLLVLSGARLVPDDLWAELDVEELSL